MTFRDFGPGDTGGTPVADLLPADPDLDVPEQAAPGRDDLHLLDRLRTECAREAPRQPEDELSRAELQRRSKAAADGWMRPFRWMDTFRATERLARSVLPAIPAAPKGLSIDAGLTTGALNLGAVVEQAAEQQAASMRKMMEPLLKAQDTALANFRKMLAPPGSDRLFGLLKAAGDLDPTAALKMLPPKVRARLKRQPSRRVFPLLRRLWAARKRTRALLGRVLRAGYLRLRAAAQRVQTWAAGLLPFGGPWSSAAPPPAPSKADRDGRAVRPVREVVAAGSWRLGRGPARPRPPTTREVVAA